MRAVRLTTDYRLAARSYMSFTFEAHEILACDVALTIEAKSFIDKRCLMRLKYNFKT